MGVLRHQAWIWCFILLLGAGIRARYFTGLQVGDDVVYSRIAADHIQGDWRVYNVHAARWGFLLPITASYGLFGPGEVPLLLYNLLCSLATVVVAGLLARRLFGPLAGWMAGLLVAVHPLLVYYATEGHTDTPLAFWTALIMLCLLRADESDRPARILFLAGVLLAWAYATKEAVVALAPFFIGHKILRGRPWSWYFPMAAPCLAAVVGESILYAATVGDPWYRLTLIRQQHAGGYMIPSYSGVGPILYRMFLELPLRLFVPIPKYPTTWNGLINVACLAAGFVLWRRKVKGIGLLAGWFLSIYAFYSLCPSSLIPFRPGFFLFPWTMPVLIVPLACCGAGLFQENRIRAGIVGLLVAATSVFAVHRSWPEARRWGDGPREAWTWIVRENPARVFSDPHCVQAFDFFDGHRPRRVYEEFERGRADEEGVRVVDKLRTEPGHWWSDPVPHEVLHPPAGWLKVYDSERIAIYRVVP